MQLATKNLSAKQIVEQLANDPVDHDERIPMSAIINILSRIEGIDNDLIGKLWQLRAFKDNIFGHGIDTWAERELHEIDMLLNIFAEAMDIMRYEFNPPFNAMMTALRRNAYFTEAQQHEVMLSFIECETLASFVYWCPVDRLKRTGSNDSGGKHLQSENALVSWFKRVIQWVKR